MYLELYSSALLLFSAFFLFLEHLPTHTLLSIAAMLSGLIFNCLDGDHQLSSILFVPAAHIQHLILPHPFFHYLSCGSELRFMSGKFFSFTNVKISYVLKAFFISFVKSSVCLTCCKAWFPPYSNMYCKLSVSSLNKSINHP